MKTTMTRIRTAALLQPGGTLTLQSVIALEGALPL